MAWTDNLTAQSGDFAVVQSMLTQANGVVLDDIYSAIESWIEAQPQLVPLPPDLVGTAPEPQAISGMEELIATGTGVNCTMGDVPGLNADSTASLQALGLIRSDDAVHITPTELGWQFIQAMRLP